MKKSHNNTSWYRGWFLCFCPFLYFSYGIFQNIYKVYFYEIEYKIVTTNIAIDNSIADSAGDVYSYSTLINQKEVQLETFKSDVAENYLSNKWCYAHPELSNAGIGETSAEIAEKAKIKVWYHPKSSIAYVISEPKYEKEFPANEIIWRNLKWFFGFTIPPFYFFCRWIIEWLRVIWFKQKLRKEDENSI